MYDEGIVSHIRIGWPGKYIHENYPEFTVSISKGAFDPWDINTLSKFDIIHFHKYFGRYESAAELFPLLQARGVKLVMDLDDYWEWPDYMPITKVMKDAGLYAREVNNFKLVDYVTTTTNILADKIKVYNENVIVLPNALNNEIAMWQDYSVETDVVKIGWFGVIQRTQDLKRLKKGIQMLYFDKSLEGRFSMMLCGGDPEDSEIFDGPGFERLDARNAIEYGYLFDKVDVCLAPLDRNEFNSCRSELKFIDAGMKKKVFIGENFGPYAASIKHNVNGLLVDEPEDWYTHIKSVILDEELRNSLRTELHKEVVDKFSLKVVTKKRVDFYKSLIKK